MHAYCEYPDIILCGNKSDLEDRRVIKEWRAKEFADKNGLSYFETSSATGQNVALVIDALLEKVMVRMETAVDRALLPGRRGRPRDLNESEEYNIPPTQSTCSC
ncbi:hypothetical protein FQR65_LT07729 [Abscondita terminalis]|nr:hypothetical protein FQR65_LT07729 [Abscondita terminalis]